MIMTTQFLENQMLDRHHADLVHISVITDSEVNEPY